MNRRDFLKLAAGALAALGLKAKGEIKSTPEAVEVFGKLPPLRPFWPTSGYVSMPLGKSSTASASGFLYYTTGDPYWGTDADLT